MIYFFKMGAAWCHLLACQQRPGFLTSRGEHRSDKLIVRPSAGPILGKVKSSEHLRRPENEDGP